MLALVFATDDESYFLRKVLGKKNLQRVSNVDVYVYKMDEHIFYLFHTGIGKVNAASVLNKIINFFSIKRVLNIGSVGGISDHVDISDIILAKQLAYNDVDLTAFGYRYGQIPNCPETFTCKNELSECCATILRNQNELKLHQGLITTGDSYITTQNVGKIKKYFPNCLAVDMEACAFAQVCRQNKILFSSLKIVSDLPLKNIDGKTYHQSMEKVMKQIAKFVPEILKYFFYTKIHTLI